MKSLLQLSARQSVPAATAWYLETLGVARGKQDLFTMQSPEKLEALRQHAIVESAVSSNRIEGVVVETGRMMTVVLGERALKDRDEEDVRGYGAALKQVHEKAAKLPIDERTIKDLHRTCRGELWDAGVYKEKDGDIIERYPDGRERIRFRTVSALETRKAMSDLVEAYHRAVEERWAPLPIVIAAFNLDFLCVHPFRDGNGRVSRLLLLLGLYHAGLEVGRYISLERLIEENKERYYQTLEESSRDWHDGRHDIWPYTNFVLSILSMAYKQFEERVGSVRSPRGAKMDRVTREIDKAVGPFRVADLQRQCPGVSIDSIRRTLKTLRADGRVECLGRGQNAEWQKTPSWRLGSDD